MKKQQGDTTHSGHDGQHRRLTRRAFFAASGAAGLGVTDPWDPVQNLTGGATYLRKMLDRYGDVRRALAAYNAGPGNVDKYGGIPPFEETQKYVRRVTDIYDLFRDERPVLPVSMGHPQAPALP